jgi:hypothetical protein
MPLTPREVSLKLSIAMFARGGTRSARTSGSKRWWSFWGPKPRGRGNLVFGYFVNLLGVVETGHRVVYAESIFDDRGADAILATMLTDRRLSVDFCRRAAYGARSIGRRRAGGLLQLFGRLGVP